MKKLFVLLLFVGLFSTMFGQTLNGFMGNSFGCSTDTIESFIYEKGGVIDHTLSNDNTIVCNNINFAGKETYSIIFKFFDNQFFEAVVILECDLESNIINDYNNIVNELSEKYFSPTRRIESYNYPYEKNDGYTNSAIRLGKSKFASLWVFELNNVIGVEIRPSMTIIITYQNNQLVEKAIEKQNNKNFKDY